jgi:hypothetical protein
MTLVVELIIAVTWWLRGQRPICRKSPPPSG